MKVVTKIFTVIALLAVFVVSFATMAQDELEEQTILLTFIPNIQFAPVYVGIESGYYAEAGYEIDVQYIEEPQVADLVAANQNQFGIVSGEQVMIASEQGRPLVYVYSWFQQFPIGIVYSSDLEIETVEDLVDLQLGIPGPFGATYTGLITLLNSADIAVEDIALDSIGFNAPEVFCVGAVDASVVYVNNEPLQIQNRAQAGDCGDVENVSVLAIADVIDLVSNGLITNQETIENDPELVETFVDIYDRSLSLIINNPARGYLLSAPYVDGLPLSDELATALEDLATAQDEFLATEPTREEIATSRVDMYDTLLESFDSTTLLQFEVLLESIELWDAEQLGYIDGEAWVNMQETLLTLGLLEEAVDLEALYTNEFLPEVVNE